MALNIVVSDTVRFKVSGTINDDKGVAQPFDFWLTAERLADTAAVQAYVKEMHACESETPITDTIMPRVRGWSGVRAGDGSEVPYSEAAFRGVMNLPGMAFLVHQAFLREVGAKEKN